MGEGLHFYKIDGKYFITSAWYENRMRMPAARADRPEGPYEINQAISIDEDFGLAQGYRLADMRGTKPPYDIRPGDPRATGKLSLHQGGIIQTPTGRVVGLLDDGLQLGGPADGTFTHHVERRLAVFRPRRKSRPDAAHLGETEDPRTAADSRPVCAQRRFRGPGAAAHLAMESCARRATPGRSPSAPGISASAGAARDQSLGCAQHAHAALDRTALHARPRCSTPAAWRTATPRAWRFSTGRTPGLAWSARNGKNAHRAFR